MSDDDRYDELNSWYNDESAVLDDLLATLTKYVVFANKESAVAVTLWIATTHALPAFECAPRLVITSPQKRCGKTRALDIVAGTCHKPLATSDATVAAIFRSLGGDHPPTLVIDEADAIFGSKKAAEQNEDLRKLLNAGHQRGRPALRCVGPSQTPTEFSVFAMAAIAGIGAMPDTITDRAVNISLRRRTNDERVSQYRSRRDKPTLDALRNRLTGWAARHLETLQSAVPEMPVEDRAADTWEPLIAVADAAGGNWPELARTACKALEGAASEADEESSLNLMLLNDMKQIFNARTPVAFMPSAELVTALRRIAESPWQSFDLTASKLAHRLREFGIKPRRDTTGDARGYRLDDLSDVFRRYTRQKPSETSDAQLRSSFSSDTLGASDTLDRQTISDRQTRSQQSCTSDGFSDGLTVSDGSTAWNVPTASLPFCAGCGTHYAARGYHSANCTATSKHSTMVEQQQGAAE